MGYKWLESIADRMKSEIDKGMAPEPERLTVRQLLDRFGYERLSAGINNHIRVGMKQFGLCANPDFTLELELESPIAIGLDADAAGAPRPPRAADPTRRVGQLDAARRTPVSVKPDSPLAEATTKMQMHGYSRLPVMRTERDVSGMLTWESIGARTALGLKPTHVRDCMEQAPAQVIPDDTRLFDAISQVSKHGYVLVRAGDRTIAGIVTAKDVAGIFRKLARPFLLIGEIEGHLRNLVHGKFTLGQLRTASGAERPIEGPADLTFGGYKRLLENEENWKRLQLGIDRREFIRHLDAVREIRNEVMHFNPDGLDDDKRQTILNAARFFDQLARLTAA